MTRRGKRARLSAALRRRRKALEHSQEGAARAMGITSATVARWEQERNSPNSELYWRAILAYLELEKRP